MTRLHICFEVDDLEAALVGRDVLIEPTQPVPELRVAFICDEGAPIELIQIVGLD